MKIFLNKRGKNSVIDKWIESPVCWRFCGQTAVTTGATADQSDSGGHQCGAPQTEPGGDPTAGAAPPLHQCHHQSTDRNKDCAGWLLWESLVGTWITCVQGLDHRKKKSELNVKTREPFKNKVT